MSDMETRDELLASAARHEHELEQALTDLKVAVHRPFAIGERIAENPVPWLIGSVLIGLWLGTRNGHG
jgi:hypothetical protein